MIFLATATITRHSLVPVFSRVHPYRAGVQSEADCSSPPSSTYYLTSTRGRRGSATHIFLARWDYVLPVAVRSHISCYIQRHPEMKTERPRLSLYSQRGS